MEYLIIYRKKNGTYFYRLIRSYVSQKIIGSITSANWLVVDVQQFYKGRYYHIKEFEELIEKDYKKERKKDIRKEKINNKIDYLLYHNINLKK